MRNLFYKITAFSVLVFMLAGCAEKDIKCSDDDVRELVEEIYTKQIRGMDTKKIQKEDVSLLNFQNILLAGMLKKLSEFDHISSIRAISYDDKVKLRRCKAIMHFKDETKTDFSYTVQIDEEDSDKFYVELDTEFLQSLLTQNMFKNIMDKDKNKTTEDN